MSEVVWVKSEGNKLFPKHLVRIKNDLVMAGRKMLAWKLGNTAIKHSSKVI